MAIKPSEYKEDIEVLGRVSSDQKAELMQKSHALLVTSVKEGWGLVVTEANSQGTPAVVYDVDGLRDSVKNDATGSVSDTTPGGMAKKISLLLNNASLYDKIRSGAHAWSKQITFEKSYNEFKERIIV